MTGSSDRARDRFVSLDAIRAVACLMVVACHISLYQGDTSLGGLKNGVTLFFALSGYLLYRPFVVADVDLRRYAVHRITRIMPAYLLALVGVTLLTGASTFLDQPLVYLLFLQNYDLRLWQGFLGVSWTLVIEVLFYLTLPALALVVAKSPMRLTVITGCSALGAVAVILFIPTTDARLTSSVFPLMLWSFAPGMFVALLEGQIRWAARPMTLVLGVALLAAGTQSAWASVDVASGFGAFFVIAWAVERRPSLGIAAVPASIGAALTYSIYLWHVDLLRVIPSTPVALLVVVVVAGLAYLLVERPFINIGRVLARPLVREPRGTISVLEGPAVVSADA